MIVVSDTSPIRALAQVGLMHALETLYGEVLVPPAVARELGVTVLGVATVDLASIPYLRIQTPTATEVVRLLAMRLGQGESEAIALALEMHAQRVIMDDGAGRVEAARRGLVPVGVLGVLLESKSRGIIPALGPVLARLEVEIQFRISDRVRLEILRTAGEA